MQQSVHGVISKGYVKLYDEQSPAATALRFRVGPPESDRDCLESRLQVDLQAANQWVWDSEFKVSSFRCGG